MYTVACSLMYINGNNCDTFSTTPNANTLKTSVEKGQIELMRTLILVCSIMFAFSIWFRVYGCAGRSSSTFSINILQRISWNTP